MARIGDWKQNKAGITNRHAHEYGRNGQLKWRQSSKALGEVAKVEVPC
jgi:hypothetical protein